MRVTVRQAAVAILVTATACSQPKPAMRTPAPDRYTTYGDTAHFGENAVVSVDAAARYVALDVRRPARLFMYAMDQQYNLHTMATCFVERGRVRIQPTLATMRTYTQSTRGSGEQWTYRQGDAVVVILIDEEPREARRACDHSGDGRFVGTITPQEMLRTYALGLKRYPDSPWASYLVEP